MKGSADYQSWMFAGAGISLMIIAAYSFFVVVEEVIEEQRIEDRRAEEIHLPAFASITNVKERKTAFFDFLRPFVDEANREILKDRAEILQLQQYFERNGKLNGRRIEKLNTYLEQYDFEAVADSVAERDIRDLLNRADTIPASLVLAQAAIESGWGTSRFAREGNNLFGMWCYEPGCGIVPRRRPAGRTYEVAAYNSPRESFEAYLGNLNTNSSYAALREIRYSHRSNGVEPSGSDLAAGLVKYSQERWEYVDKVRGMISSNRLEL